MWGAHDNLGLILNTWQQLVLDGCDPAWVGGKELVVLGRLRNSRVYFVKRGCTNLVSKPWVWVWQRRRWKGGRILWKKKWPRSKESYTKKWDRFVASCSAWVPWIRTWES